MSFESALKVTLRFEGGYANSLKDSGGETFQGISRKWNPQWPGWSKIDAIKIQLVNNRVIKDLQGFFKNKNWKLVDDKAATDSSLPGLISKLYYNEYYNPLLKYNFQQQLLDKMFDIRVNISSENGNKILQHALIDCGKNIAVDGIIGKITLEAISKVDLNCLLNAICNQQFLYYENYVLKKFPDARQSFKDRAFYIPSKD
jgi:lysozyme family protein